MMRKTIKSLEATLATVRELLAAESNDRQKSSARAAAAEKREKDTREQFADLKTRLHASEIENARLRGYIERVNENDDATEELVEIKLGNETHRVPKGRVMELMRAVYEPPIKVYRDQGEKQNNHWTNY